MRGPFWWRSGRFALLVFDAGLEMRNEDSDFCGCSRRKVMYARDSRGCTVVIPVRICEIV